MVWNDEMFEGKRQEVVCDSLELIFDQWVNEDRVYSVIQLMSYLF